MKKYLINGKTYEDCKNAIKANGISTKYFTRDFWILFSLDMAVRDAARERGEDTTVFIGKTCIPLSSIPFTDFQRKNIDGYWAFIHFCFNDIDI